ncbi:MAG: Crp/Fnr family transcriptional regulator [Desulfobacula sp.]|nr:Crp/Fnr family transcriptional regulator [Desulfobacula sp.]
MSGIKQVLKQSPVFSTIEEDDVENLDAIFDKWDVHAGDILATIGDPAQYFFLLEKGIVLLAMDGGKSVVLNACGDFIGMELLSAKGKYNTTLTVLEDGCVYVIPRRAFLKIIQEDTQVADAIMSSWQIFLDQTAPFAKDIEDASLPDKF